MEAMVIVKLLDLALLGITAGMSYAAARDKNEAVILEIEAMRSKVLLGEKLDEADEARLSVLVEQAQQARKEARARVPVPDDYQR